MSASSAVRHSGLQKEVLSLYRTALRAAMAKPVGQRESTAEYIRSEFRFQVSGETWKHARGGEGAREAGHPGARRHCSRLRRRRT